MYKNIVRLSSIHVDNGGRRSGQDRRRFAYSNHIPERRLIRENGISQDRRGGKDRRIAFRERTYSGLGSTRRIERRIVHR
jgi:hypothetical protein